MVHWTEEEVKCIHDIVGKASAAEIGHDALSRLLIVYPWCQRYFSAFGNLNSEDAIIHNAHVKSHGQKVVTSIIEASNHLNDLKGYYAKLSRHHSEKLHVDPANFNLFRSILIIVFCRHYPKQFDADCQHALNKFFGVISDALGKQYF